MPRRWRQRMEERRHLSGLSDHVLADMGLMQAEVAKEAVKPFWKPVALHSRVRERQT